MVGRTEGDHRVFSVLFYLGMGLPLSVDGVKRCCQHAIFPKGWRIWLSWGVSCEHNTPLLFSALPPAARTAYPCTPLTASQTVPCPLSPLLHTEGKFPFTSIFFCWEAATKSLNMPSFSSYKDVMCIWTITTLLFWGRKGGAGEHSAMAGGKGTIITTPVKSVHAKYDKLTFFSVLECHSHFFFFMVWAELREGEMFSTVFPLFV